MKNANQSLLDYFGQKLIKNSRDVTIFEEFNIIDGSAKAPESKKLHQKLKDFSPEQIATIREIIIDSVDGALNNFLWMIEEQSQIDIVSYQDDKTYSLKEISDGLSVDYWNFVDDFSDYARGGDMKIEEPSPEEYIIQTFTESPEEAKRYFIRILNNKEKFNTFKTTMHKIPRPIIENLINLTLSKSTLHRAECEELKKGLSQIN